MEKQLQEIKSPLTDLAPTDMLEKVETTPYEATDKDKQLLGHVTNRFTQMASKRTQIDRNWQMYQMQFEAIYIPYSDWRSRSNVPLEWAIIELFVSEAVSRKSIPSFEAIGWTDIVREEVIKRVWDYDFKTNSREDQLYKAEYLTPMFGTSFYFNGFESSARVIRDPEFIWGKIVWKKKLLTKNKILLEAVDIRNVYFDERVTDYEKANDCIYIEYITPEEFLALADNPDWGWNSEAIRSVGTTVKSNQAYYTNEERGMNNTGLVEMMHYWNKQSDEYVVVANRQATVKETFIPYSHKELPITPRQYWYNPFSLYGRGLCEALLNFKSEINTLKEMIMDNVKRSNNSMFAIWGWLTFDWESFGFNNTTVKFEGQLNDANFRELRWTPPNTAIFDYLQELLREIAMFVWIDPAGIIWTASSTAFETAVKTESALKRVNVVLQNRDMALNHVFKKHLQNLQQFFPIKTAKGLLEIDEETGKAITWQEDFPSIMLKDEKFVNDEFVQFDWKFPFEVKPEYIRGQIDVSVATNFNAPTLKQLKRQNLADFVKLVNEITTAIQMNPALWQTLKVEEFIKQAAFDYDVDLDSIGGFKDSLSNEKETLMKQIRAMTGVDTDAELPEWWVPAEWEEPAGSPWQAKTPWVLPNVGWDISTWALPPVRTPITPDINNLWKATAMMT